jgi:hypothetical protein
MSALATPASAAARAVLTASAIGLASTCGRHEEGRCCHRASRRAVLLATLDPDAARSIPCNGNLDEWRPLVASRPRRAPPHPRAPRTCGGVASASGRTTFALSIGRSTFAVVVIGEAGHFHAPPVCFVK